MASYRWWLELGSWIGCVATAVHGFADEVGWALFDDGCGHHVNGSKLAPAFGRRFSMMMMEGGARVSGLA